ncbi:MAG: addiction module protein [Planctomycetes bacterium]|jgi:putative addiction module component (TIGR02574 family)|nr:addiction module protein [Planctomycetota bacterium]
MKPEFQDLEKLPVAERIQLVADIWDSIARSREALPVAQWQKAELRRRKEEYRKDPESAQPWSEVKRSILDSGE